MFGVQTQKKATHPKLHAADILSGEKRRLKTHKCSRDWKDKPPTGRKYLQNTILIKDWYTKYTKNS